MVCKVALAWFGIIGTRTCCCSLAHPLHISSINPISSWHSGVPVNFEEIFHRRNRAYSYLTTSGGSTSHFYTHPNHPKYVCIFKSYPAEDVSSLRSFQSHSSTRGFCSLSNLSPALHLGQNVDTPNARSWSTSPSQLVDISS